MLGHCCPSDSGPKEGHLRRVVSDPGALGPDCGQLKPQGETSNQGATVCVFSGTPGCLCDCFSGGGFISAWFSHQFLYFCNGAFSSGPPPARPRGSRSAGLTPALCSLQVSSSSAGSSCSTSQATAPCPLLALPTLSRLTQCHTNRGRPCALDSPLNLCVNLDSSLPPSGPQFPCLYNVAREGGREWGPSRTT